MDWTSAGILWEGPSGYSSLLADPSTGTTPPTPPSPLPLTHTTHHTFAHTTTTHPPPTLTHTLTHTTPLPLSIYRRVRSTVRVGAEERDGRNVRLP
jgi:hypothetical protein